MTNSTLNQTEAMFTLPAILEPNGDTFEETVTLGGEFMRYDSQARVIYFDVEKAELGTYTIDLLLID